MKIDQDTEYFLVRIILAFFISMLVIAIIKIIDFGSALLKIAYPVATFSGGALIWIGIWFIIQHFKKNKKN